MTTASVPPSLTIGGLTYKVSVDGAHLDQQAILQGAIRGLYGLTEHYDCVITLHPENSTDRQREVLLHECLHTITEFTGVATDFGKEKDEAICLRLAPMLLTVLRQNPRLVAFLLAK